MTALAARLAAPPAATFAASLAAGLPASRSFPSITPKLRSEPSQASENKMNKSAGNVARFGEGDTNSGWGRFFRAHHPVKPAMHVAALTGAPLRTAQNWIDGVSEPSLRWFARIVAAYGVEALAVALPQHLDWLSELRRVHKKREIEAKIAALRVDLDAEFS